MSTLSYRIKRFTENKLASLYHVNKISACERLENQEKIYNRTRKSRNY